MTELESLALNWQRTTEPSAKNRAYHKFKRALVDFHRNWLKGASVGDTSPSRHESLKDSAPTLTWQDVFDRQYDVFCDMGLPSVTASTLAEREANVIIEHLEGKEAA